MHRVPFRRQDPLLLGSERIGGGTREEERAPATRVAIPASQMERAPISSRLYIAKVGKIPDALRAARGSAAWEFDVWFAFSRDGGRSWRRMHFAGPFDMNRAQALEGVGRRIGDYQGLTGLPHGFAAIFAQAPPRAKIGASDVFFAEVRTGHRPRRR